MRKASWLLLLATALPAQAAKLDLSAEVRGRYSSYDNLDLVQPKSGHQFFFSHRARMGLTLKEISLDEAWSDMDVGLAFTSIGIAGSTVPVRAPFDRAAERLPTSELSPYLSAAYIKVRSVLQSAWTATVGRQPVRIGSGLLLDDDDAGFTGVVAERPWWRDAKLSLYVFQPKNLQSGALDVYGLGLEKPGHDGTWQFHNVLEMDKAAPVYQGLAAERTVRNFTSIRYLVKQDKLEFDGEVAAQTGTATKSAAAGGGTGKFGGYAYIIEGRWKQPVGKVGVGSARMVFARGTGDKGSTVGTDEAFFPTVGHRYDGIERDGYGDFFGATTYDALGGSTTTITGMPAGVSGVQVVGLGITSPKFNKLVADLDVFYFTANRSSKASSKLGREIDLGIRYQVKDQLSLKASYAWFTAGPAINAAEPTATRVALQASGRF